jgi:hypothetical protein
MSYVGKLSTQRKTCSSTTLTTSNPARIILESIFCFHGEGPTISVELIGVSEDFN